MWFCTRCSYPLAWAGLGIPSEMDLLFFWVLGFGCAWCPWAAHAQFNSPLTCWGHFCSRAPVTASARAIVFRDAHPRGIRDELVHRM
ncbi:hypothetical protein DFH08DRAFT_856910 [Mycena albidolilacea]|uniref:Uncharacterized protein n=1 Tax=Mycena albidolilacea TaxID=1033008 RepID=A0AAD7A2B3_9AGAR|nr:hypothetical protein DFH08DRAFT_868334 [Mycena albidolilacea]KAJ7353450.1 hypothetical protein DFH08DRAFT_856910 [Mycena albidolilacea]